MKVVTKQKWTAKNTITQRQRTRTLDGLANRMYYDMSRRVRDKNHPVTAKYYYGLPICSKEEFVEFALNNSAFKFYFNVWKNYGFEQRYRPTPDRIDSNKGYLLNNITFIPKSLNSRKAGLKKRTKGGK